MASVEKYKDTAGKERFAARWREHGQQRKERGFTTAKKARDFAQAKEADAKRGMTPHRTDVTVTEYARYWASTRGHRPTTAKSTESIIKNHLGPTPLGRMKLADVRKSQVQAWASDRAKKVAPSTMKTQLMGLVKAIFTSAVDDHLIIKTPVVKIKLPTVAAGVTRPKIIPLTTADIEAVAEALPARYSAMAITQAGLGLRVGELLALRVEDVDFLRRTVRIDWQFTDPAEKDEDGRAIRSDLKTPGSHRTLPLPRRVADVLAAHIARYGVGEDGTIFTTKAGKHVGEFGDYIFRTAARRAGLPEGTSTHDLRHHYATELLAAGLSAVEVGALLGHEDGTLVLKTYGHAPVDATERAADVLNKLWAV